MRNLPLLSALLSLSFSLLVGAAGADDTPTASPIVGRNLSDILRPGGQGIGTSSLAPGVGPRTALILEQLKRGAVLDLDKALGEAELGYALAHNRELFKVAIAPSTDETQLLDKVGEEPAIVRVREQLAALWLSRHGDEVSDVQRGTVFVNSLPLSSRMLLGDYLASQEDARCVLFYQSCFLEWEKQHTDPTTGKINKTEGAVPGVHPLAWFYQSQKQWKQAAAVYLLSDKYSTNPIWVGTALLEAAQAQLTLGNQEEAKRIYAQAARSPNWFYTSSAIVQIFKQDLEQNPKQVEPQLLVMEKEVTNSDSRLPIRFLLAWAKYKSHHWKEFLSQSTEVLEDYEKIEERPRRKFFAPLALQLKDAQKWTRLWMAQSIVAEQPELKLEFNEPLQQPIERRILVDTPSPAVLQVTVEGGQGRVQVGLEESPWAPDLQQTRYQQMIVVTILPGEPAVQAVVRVQNPQQPEKNLQIPLVISSRNLINPLP